CINDEYDEWHVGLIPEWDGTMPQGHICQRADGFVRDILGTCGNEAQVGVPFAHLDEAAIENESWPPSIEFHYFCEECAAEWEAEDEMIGAYYEACEEMFPEFWAGIKATHVSRLMNGEVTIYDLAIEEHVDMVGYLIEEGELEKAATTISRLIDAMGGE
ncbi:MAG: hypothetical protein MK315_05675, partial [Candidatus Thalassarchaeum betae]|nr:hypothetical protein [Candidatus Thalassoarchaea betae]